MESIEEDLLINFDQSSTTAVNSNDMQTRTGKVLSYDTFIFIQTLFKQNKGFVSFICI